MRITTAVIVLALVLGACGGADTAPGTATAGGADPGEGTVATVQAPDFSLELGDGSTFMLSQEVLPVFMVFWAEW